MNRKQFLLTTGTVASGAALSLLLRSNLSGAPPRLLAPLFLAGIFDHATLRQLGASYLAANPTESSIPALTRLLGVGSAVSDSQADTDRLSGQLQQEVIDDFGSGRTIVIDGWILSLTEARQCALYALRSR